MLLFDRESNLRLYELYGILLMENAPFRVREPPAGPKKLSYISPEGTFLGILSILPTLVLAVLELQNFP